MGKSYLRFRIVDVGVSGIWVSVYKSGYLCFLQAGNHK